MPRLPLRFMRYATITPKHYVEIRVPRHKHTTRAIYRLSRHFIMPHYRATPRFITYHVYRHCHLHAAEN